MTDYELQEIADMAIEELHELIAVEAQLLKEEHALIDQLYNWDSILGHLYERIPEEKTDSHDILGQIIEHLLELRESLESSDLLTLEKEDVHLLEKLKKDVEHRDWKAVHQDVDKNRISISALKNIHSRFLAIMRLLKPIKKQDPYFEQLYSFLNAYERIFRHLWRKERILAKA